MQSSQPGPAEQARIIKSLHQASEKALSGTSAPPTHAAYILWHHVLCLQQDLSATCCVISRKWFDSWAAYVGFSSSSEAVSLPTSTIEPRAIDNTDLRDIEDHTVLRPGLNEQDYCVVPLLAAQQLYQWYSPANEPEFQRRMCRKGEFAAGVEHGRC
jgi:hypothetical protein